MEKIWQDKTVLIAEDEEDNYELLCAILEESEINILKATNGSEAIELYKEHQDKINLILMDIKMPELDGLEATKAIRKLNNKIPIIAQTAYALSGDRERSMEAGCSAYIPKPIDSDVLFGLLKDYLGT